MNFFEDPELLEQLRTLLRLTTPQTQDNDSSDDSDGDYETEDECETDETDDDTVTENISFLDDNILFFAHNP